MSREIDVRAALDLDPIFIDVRSEGEHQEACIPSAINIPLFTNDERKRVGITYKVEGYESARMLGLEIVAPKLPAMVRQIKALSQVRPVVIYCWRGGMRSQSVATIIHLMGLNVYRLVGGYKAYRRHVNEFFVQAKLPYHAVVISGLTGVGKTELLTELKGIGGSVIDLEGLANNRGSVFGSVGLGQQPSQKDFEARLYDEFMRLGDSAVYAVECESKRIGRIVLPPALWASMQDGVKVLVYTSVEERVQRLVRIYTTGDQGSIEGCKQAIQSLSNRLGNETVHKLLVALDCGSIDEVVEKLLADYYDPLYRYPSEPDVAYPLSVDTTDMKQAAFQIKLFMDSLNSDGI